MAVFDWGSSGIMKRLFGKSSAWFFIWNSNLHQSVTHLYQLRRHDWSVLCSSLSQLITHTPSPLANGLTLSSTLWIKMTIRWYWDGILTKATVNNSQCHSSTQWIGFGSCCATAESVWQTGDKFQDTKVSRSSKARNLYPFVSWFHHADVDIRRDWYCTFVQHE